MSADISHLRDNFGFDLHLALGPVDDLGNRLATESSLIIYREDVEISESLNESGQVNQTVTVSESESEPDSKIQCPLP